MHHRYEALDALRGLAAVSVVIYHYFIVLPVFAERSQHADTWVNLLTATPLHLIWAGYEAVLFFFLLSGFVLSLAFYSQKKPSYPAFLIKRVFRIYPAAYAAILLAVWLDLTVSRHGIPSLSTWFNSIWVSPVTIGSLLNHALLLNYFGYGQYVPVLWTLVMELRISLIFPLLMWLMRRYDWRTVLAISFVFSLGYYAFFPSNLSGGINPYAKDYLLTLTFLCMFLTGAVLARYRTRIVRFTFALLPLEKGLLLFSGLLLYTCRYWLFTQEGVTGSHSFLSDVGIITGASLFLALALSTGQKTILTSKPLVFLGRISYSVYLSHAVLFVAFVYLLYPDLPLYRIWLVSAGITLVVSYLSYTSIEKPGIRLGAKLAAYVTEQPKQMIRRRKSLTIIKLLFPSTAHDERTF